MTIPISKSYNRFVILFKIIINFAMILGDNLMTAMSVARGCDMVRSHQKIVLVSVGQGDAKPPIYMEVCKVIYRSNSYIILGFIGNESLTF